MGNIVEVIKDDIVRLKYNSLVQAILQTLQQSGNLKETIIEAKHLTINIDASGIGFNAAQLGGKTLDEIRQEFRLWALVGGE